MSAVEDHQALSAAVGIADWPQLWAAVDNILDLHQPIEIQSVNSLDCPEHNPNTNREGHLRALRASRGRGQQGVFADCPDCVLTPVTSCTYTACCEWPCKTIDAVYGALGGEWAAS